MEKISERYLDNLKKEILDLQVDLSKIEIISSDVTGVGKSTHIKNEIFGNNKNYKYFPIGGVFSKLDIIKRLKNLKLDKYSAIHIDLYDTEEIKLMEEFLHFLLIKKSYGVNENIINISNDIEIKIEIQNSYKDYFILFPILTLFPTKKLSIKNLSPLKISSDIFSKIQIVANYLKALKNDEIEQFDLYFGKTTPLDLFNNKAIKQAKPLPQNECEELIFDEIRQYIFEPNYYEITSFINYLYIQFISLNSYSDLSLKSLNLDNQSFKFKTFIIKTIIKDAIYFIESSHLKFLKDKKMINEMIPIINGSNLGIENLIRNEEKAISFYNLYFPLLFFNHKDGNLFSIIANMKSKDKEFNDFYKFDNYNKFRNYKKINLTSPGILSQKDFIDNLKRILDLNTPIKEDYAFIVDNFIKIIYLFVRVNANIPIVIFGDKTIDKFNSIIKLIDTMNNGNDNTMILEIHSNTSEKNIIDFIEQKVLPKSTILVKEEFEEKIKNIMTYKPKKIFVILKGINTCKSMGIISQLIINNSFQGKPLPSNIVFIGICESYVPEEERFMEIAKKMELKKEEMEKLKSIKYEDLYPLPSSLINYLIYFGDLSIQDKKIYISEIIKHKSLI